MKIKVSSTMVLALVMLAALALQTNTAAGQAINDSHWTFDEADVDGATVKDVWNNRDGEIIGNAPLVDGKKGKGIELNGIDQNIVVSALNISPSTYPDITLTAWVYPTSTGAGGQADRRFLFGHDDGGWDRGLLLEGTQWKLGTGSAYWDSGVSVEVDSWQHVAIVYDATDITFYMNGVASSHGSPGTLGDGNSSLLIGTHPSQARFFQGIVDEVYAYDIAMSESEIQQNMEEATSSVSQDNKLSTTWAKIKSER